MVILENPVLASQLRMSSWQIQKRKGLQSVSVNRLVHPVQAGNAGHAV